MWDAVSGGNQLQNTVIGQAAGMKTNRIASVNGTAFSYDASGNVINDGARTCTYDAENRIVSVSAPAAKGLLPLKESEGEEGHGRSGDAQHKGKEMR